MFEAEKFEAKCQFLDRKHTASLILNNDKMCVIDWRRANGDGDYSVRYYIDKEKGRLMIDGDLGSCIASWHAPNTTHDITSYTRDICYFMEKIETASNQYYIDAEDLMHQIEKVIAENDSHAKDDPDYEDDMQALAADMDMSYGKDGSFKATQQQDEILQKYIGDDWYDFDINWEDIHPRVFLWAVGLQMAVRQLTDEGKLSKKD